MSAAERAAAPGVDVAALRRREFPWADRGELIYLNSASTGPLPQRTVEALAAFNARRATPNTITADEQLGVLARARTLAAQLVGAEPAQIALMPNTSHGINLAARALPLGPGDVVLTVDREFPANVYPWMALADRGVTLERVPCVDGLPDEEALLRALDRPGVRVVAVSWVSFVTGYQVALARLGRACRERGIFLFVDAIQGVGAAPLDAAACGIDLLACGGQKWLLSPWGSGFAYVHPRLIERLTPPAVGWMAVQGSEDFGRLLEYDLTFHADARRFEVATLPYQDFVGFNASVGLLAELGPAAVAAHVAALVGRVVAWAEGRRDVRLLTPADPARRLGIVSLLPADARAAQRLTDAGVAFSLREDAIRLAPHCFNTVEEIDRVLALLDGAAA